MIWQIDLSILSLVVICAFATIMVKDLLSAAIALFRDGME